MSRRTILLLVAVLVAALGTALILLYVKGINDRATEGQALVEVLVADDVINVNEAAADAQAAGKFVTKQIPSSAKVEGALSSLKSLEGKVALGEIFPGEQILAQKFGQPGSSGLLPIPDDLMAISVELSDPARVAGFVNNGSEVAIFASADPQLITASGDERPLSTTTRIIATRVLVIGVGDTTVTTPSGSGNDQNAATDAAIPRTILTIAVTQTQAEKVLYAARNGDLAFALLTANSTVQDAQGVTGANLYPELYRAAR
jgi:pilus assembly protein CpaB